MANKNHRNSLMALTAAALCLPGYSEDASAWASPEGDASYRYSFYKEADLPAATTSGSNTQRYEISSHQFHLLQPLGENWDLTTNLMVETMSGASPWYLQPGANGQPLQVMSGATIDEERYALDTRVRHYREEGRESLMLGVSKERDYQSLSGGLETETEFDERRMTLSAGVSASFDRLEPTEGGSTRFPGPPRVVIEDKHSVSAYAGLSRILTQTTVVQWSASFGYADGYLSDPYKLAYVESLPGNLVADTRPGHRAQWATTFKLRQYLAPLGAAVHLDYRYFGDSWGVVSDTVELAWHQNIPGGWKIIPALRWYQQGAADFYRNTFTSTRADGNYTSDYRLSAYGALSGRLGLEKSFGGLTLSLAGEYYEASTSYSLHETDVQNPGVVEFTAVTAFLGYRF